MTAYTGFRKAQSVKAKILTDSYEIEGLVQLKPGMRGNNISDLLMSPDSNFIPITQAKSLNRESAHSLPIKTDCTIVHASKIKMVLPCDE